MAMQQKMEKEKKEEQGRGRGRRESSIGGDGEGISRVPGAPPTSQHCSLPAALFYSNAPHTLPIIGN